MRPIGDIHQPGLVGAKQPFARDVTEPPCGRPIRARLRETSRCTNSVDHADHRGMQMRQRNRDHAHAAGPRGQGRVRCARLEELAAGCPRRD